MAFVGKQSQLSFFFIYIIFQTSPWLAGIVWKSITKLEKQVFNSIRFNSMQCNAIIESNSIELISIFQCLDLWEAGCGLEVCPYIYNEEITPRVMRSLLDRKEIGLEETKCREEETP